ncbi:RNA-binding protein 4.1-like isoform X4 [Oncorhynchus keta]|uniref:RNA-binding protein 4.1-like isoform X4 n=1 Tax=Oncorhynchus keta TaxID=8018 RepID=UPI0015FA3224|nr:RNA-binding protein 4.1-like isoform X4 [Oncorhynchus keta]
MVKIFIGNLASGTTQDELRTLFSEYGKISECDIVKNFGFVHMKDKAEAEEAIKNLHHYELNGAQMNVEMSHGRPKSTTKLHVSNIPEGCTNEELKTKFEAYGPVVEADIVKDYAFVHMESVDDAMEAISGLDNTAFQGLILKPDLVLPCGGLDRDAVGSKPPAERSHFSPSETSGINPVSPS